MGHVNVHSFLIEMLNYLKVLEKNTRTPIIYERMVLSDENVSIQEKDLGGFLSGHPS